MGQARAEGHDYVERFFDAAAAARATGQRTPAPTLPVATPLRTSPSDAAALSGGGFRVGVPPTQAELDDLSLWIFKPLAYDFDWSVRLPFWVEQTLFRAAAKDRHNVDLHSWAFARRARRARRARDRSPGKKKTLLRIPPRRP
jgi:hypothetical protein